MKVAWIGLGHMGLPKARAVAAAGHEVTSYDVRSLDPAETEGLRMAACAREAADGCELVCLALFSDEQVEEVLTGPEGLFPMLQPGTVVAVFTTGTIASARMLAERAPYGIAILDTCFSNQVGMLEAGKLNLLVGGDEAALDRCRPVFEIFAEEIFHLGGPGAGRAIKLVNNLMWVGHIQLSMDAMKLAGQLDLDPIETARIILKCTGSSDVLKMFAKAGFDELYDFMRPYMVKDASAAAEAARDVEADLGPLGALVQDYLN